MTDAPKVSIRFVRDYDVIPDQQPHRADQCACGSWFSHRGPGRPIAFDAHVKTCRVAKQFGKKARS